MEKEQTWSKLYLNFAHTKNRDRERSGSSFGIASEIGSDMLAENTRAFAFNTLME